MAPVPMQKHRSVWRQFLSCSQPTSHLDDEESVQCSEDELEYGDGLSDVESDGGMSTLSDESGSSRQSSPDDAQAFPMPNAAAMEALGRLAVQPMSALPSLWSYLQPALEQSQEPARAISGALPIGAEELAKVLVQVAAEARLQDMMRKPGNFSDALEGIWLGGKHEQVIDTLGECDIVEVDCRRFSSGRFRDIQASSSLTFARNVRALRELAGDIHRARVNGNVVYVHCVEGKNRSPAALIAYLLLYVPSVKSLAAAFSLVGALRKEARTNTNTFYQELLHICRSKGKTVMDHSRSCRA